MDRTRDFSTAVDQHVTVCALGIMVFLFSAPSLCSQGSASALQARALEAGRKGEFSVARQDLEDAAGQLKAVPPGGTDFSGNAQRIAALGFVQLLHKVAADCAGGGRPASVGAQLFAAGSAARNGNLDGALSEAAAAVAKSKSYAPAHALLGRARLGKCLGSGHDCGAAIQSFLEALRLDPGLLMAELDLGMAFTHTDDLEGGIRAYQRVLKLDQDGSFAGIAHAQLALLHAKRANWAVADQHAKRAASLGWTLPLGLAQDIAKRTSAGDDAALFDAVSTGDRKGLQALLDKGANVNARSRGKGTLLHGAALKGQLDIVDLLIKKGADVNAKDDGYAATPLHLAAYLGHKQIVQALLLAGADVNAKDRDGDTPLDNALAGGHREAAEVIKTFAKKRTQKN